MKTRLARHFFLICLMLLIGNLSMMAKRAHVERGMTKQQVTSILGQPDNTSFDENGETWEYFKSPFMSNYTNRIVVYFDRDDRVRACQSSTIDYQSNTPLGYGRRPGAYPAVPVPNPGCYSLDDESYTLLYNKVRDASFDDNRFDLIQVACLGCWFSCSQVAGLLKLFSFSNAKLKALGMMARRITDPQNAVEIYRMFDFFSDKDKAAEMMGDHNLFP